ncbi:MAG: hypothetical protein ABSB97_03160 [Thermoplasmata archaeon]
MVASVALFVAGAASWWARLQAGPPRFPLWALLVVLGFVASIGAVLSWFLGGGETEVVSPLEDEKDSPFHDGGADQVERSGPVPELGRPAPDVRRPNVESKGLVKEPAPWDEGPVDVPAATPAAAPMLRPATIPDIRSPAPATVSPPPAWTYADAELAIRELDGIQQEIVPRRKRSGGAD